MLLLSVIAHFTVAARKPPERQPAFRFDSRLAPQGREDGHGFPVLKWLKS
jgi:hypothetical protein